MIKSRSLIKGSLSEMSSSICISFQKIFLLELRFVYCVSSRILSIGSQVNRRDPTLIRLCRRHAEKMHWSTNSNDTAQLCSMGQKQLQPGLLAVTHGSCQVALSDKFDLPQLNDGVKKKKKKKAAKVALELTWLKATFIHKQSWFFSLCLVTPFHICFFKCTALVTSASLLYLDFCYE